MYGDAGYGNAVIIRHGFGFYTMYAHLQSVSVHTGMKVQKKTLIGFMGRTGRVTGPHLHYEVWKGYQNRTNPLNFICSTDLYSGICQRFNSK
jgi:murein DD-endopeptidase MepM/ murein hydrolase activator NlpD